jgi:hypothetical protein
VNLIIFLNGQINQILVENLNLVRLFADLEFRLSFVHLGYLFQAFTQIGLDLHLVVSVGVGANRDLLEYLEYLTLVEKFGAKQGFISQLTQQFKRL